MLGCPGSGPFKQPKPEDLKCSRCNAEIEIWSDEAKAKCPSCGNIVLRKFSGNTCLDWCKEARFCVGDKVYKNYIQGKAASLKQGIVEEMERYFGDDTKRIRHARNVMGFAEMILKEHKADWHIVIPASLLHDIGIKRAQEKYGSTSGHYQEIEGPAIAEAILNKLGVKKSDIDEICQIIAHHHSPGIVNTENFKVLYDADWLVNLKDEYDIKDRQKLIRIIDRVFLTETGKRLANDTYVNLKRSNL